MSRLGISRSQILFAALALILSFLLVRGLVQMPAYPDAYYHFNVANRLTRAEGFVDDFVWTYIGSPDQLPAPSHLYWMPLTSVVASLGMSLFNAPGDYASAQFFFILLLAGTGLVAYRLAFMLGRGNRHAWIAGTLTLLGGFFAARWGTMDTFTPYAFIGSMSLLFVGLGLSADKHNRLYWIVAGLFAGFGHLTRADGLLLLLTAWAGLLFPFDFFRAKVNRKRLFQQRLLALILVTIGYIAVMSPWFMRNFAEVGTILPVGGTQSIWFTEYNDLFSYPPDASPAKLFENGIDIFIQSRWTAFTNNLGTFVAVEGMVILVPLFMIALWKRRSQTLLRGVWIFALGIHLAMTLVFPFPGYRGGLFHAVSALVPFWTVLGILGLDDVIEWVAQRRRTWNANVAKPIFSVMLLMIGIVFTISVGLPARVGWGGLPRLHKELMGRLPANTRIMINDPAQLYHFTGMGGVPLPNESFDIIPAIAEEYDVDYLVIELIQSNGQSLAVPPPMHFDYDNPPNFLEMLPFESRDDVRLYAIIR